MLVISPAASALTAPLLLTRTSTAATTTTTTNATAAVVAAARLAVSAVAGLHSWHASSSLYHNFLVAANAASGATILPLTASQRHRHVA